MGILYCFSQNKITDFGNMRPILFEGDLVHLILSSANCKPLWFRFKLKRLINKGVLTLSL